MSCDSNYSQRAGCACQMFPPLTAPDDTVLLTAADAAAYLGMPKKAFEELRAMGYMDLPRFRSGGTAFYRVVDLDFWLDTCLIEIIDEQYIARAVPRVP